MKKLLIGLPLMMLIQMANSQQLKVNELRCAYLQNPIGVDQTKPMLHWKLTSNQRSVMQTAYQILVSDDSLALLQHHGNTWKSGWITSSQSIQVAYAGKPLVSAKKYYWKIQVKDNKGNTSHWSEIASWRMGLLQKEDWKNAQWMAYEILPDSSKIIPALHGNGKKEWGAGKDVLPLFRKSFAVSKKVKEATFFVSGLGHFEMSLNGKKIGDHFLDPGWTQYSKHALYVGFDLTGILKNGENCLGAELGNGFYYQPRERYRKITGAYGYPKMICRLTIVYTDGSTENIVSDGTWKTSPSPTYFSSIYGGEDYDANLEQKGWNQAGFEDGHWETVKLTNGPTLESQMAEPLKIMKTFSTVSVRSLGNQALVYDLGQNMSGIPLIKVQGRTGDTIRIYTAELLNQDGTINQKATGSPSYYTYVLKGNGIESWQPKFTYYGFRYVQIQRAVQPGEPNSRHLPVVLELKGLHTSNAAKSVGSFTSSNTLFNQTNQLIDWAIKSNMASVFTDCPHREKLGWLEEAHLVGASVKFEYDIASLCRKIVRDMQVAQTADGLIPDIAPEYVQFEKGFRDSPEWGSNAILLPWYLYQWYGDKQVLEESYEMMQRYLAYLDRKSNQHILSHGLGDWYDLGPKSPGESQLTPKGITATAIFYHDLEIMSKIAQLLGKKADQEHYQTLAALVKTAFNQQFFKEATNQYATGSQTANAMALYMNLVEPTNRQAVLNNLVTDLTNRNFALTAGDIGYRYLLKILDKEGRSNLIFAMNNRNDVPGYGYQLAHGATALTESWQALPNVSNNHFMLGHLMEWFYEGLGGISQMEDGVGFEHILIRPQVVGDLKQVTVNYQSIHGLIQTDWKKSIDFELNLQIPVNTRATVEIPATLKNLVFESGKSLGKIAHLKILERTSEKLIVSIGSGAYHFKVKQP
jgi:alpha-L-rhamnosidase